MAHNFSWIRFFFSLSRSLKNIHPAQRKQGKEGKKKPPKIITDRKATWVGDGLPCRRRKVKSIKKWI